MDLADGGEVMEGNRNGVVAMPDASSRSNG
jgi:hypothetical protein